MSKEKIYKNVKIQAKTKAEFRYVADNSDISYTSAIFILPAEDFVVRSKIFQTCAWAL